jgi:hypothetical protein
LSILAVILLLVFGDGGGRLLAPRLPCGGMISSVITDNTQLLNVRSLLFGGMISMVITNPPNVLCGQK